MAQPPKPDDLSTDILEMLKAQPAPSADLARKEETIFRATALFSEKISNQPQKIGLGARLFGIGGNKAHNQRGYFMKKRHILAASVATIALLTVIVPQMRYHQANNSYVQLYSAPLESQSSPSNNSGDQLSGILLNTQRNISSVPSFLGPAGDFMGSFNSQDAQPDAEQPDFAVFSNKPDQQMQDTLHQPVSTFSADVDTASYSTVRKYLMAGAIPPIDAVRTEELVNYFDYSYPKPDAGNKLAFAATTSVLPNPWNSNSKLIHIGIKGSEPAAALGNERPAANIVLLVDVSGSMHSSDKLALAKQSFLMMLDKLDERDTVSIVTYAGASAVVLQPTPASNKDIIRNAITRLSAGGGTAGADGINTAYQLARANFKKEGINRIFLATDGDFNVGVSSPAELANMVSREKESGIFLSVLGFGMSDSYSDRMMQGLAQNGNGVASYIDSSAEAKRVLVDNLHANLVTIAKDVKMQVEFDPDLVSSYRLLGYETRALAQADFDNDKVDAGDIGAGHKVTAIYEIVPKTDLKAMEAGGSVAKLRIRYKAPDAIISDLVEHQITVDPALLGDINKASDDVRFAVAVAGFSRLLRQSDGVNSFGMQQVYDLAKGATGEDADNSRHEFLTLVNRALSLNLGQAVVPAQEGGVAFPP